MKAMLRLTTWAGPLTIGSFVVVAVTGILMFFHLNFGLTKLAHEWLGWALVFGGVAHLVVNWRPFLAYFRKTSGIAIIAVLLVLGAASLVGGSGPRGRPPFMGISQALEDSSVGLVAQVAKVSPASLVDDLNARGIRTRNPEQTIREIAAENGVPSMVVLAHVFREPPRDRRAPPGAPSR